MTKNNHAQVGVLMGAGAILLWSSMGSVLTIGGQRLDAWQFMACTAAVGCLFQFCFHAVQRKNIRSCVVFNGKVWILLVLFVADMMLYMWALSDASSKFQKCSVNVVHYFWPIICVFLSVIVVPETRFTKALLAATFLSVVGLLLSTGGPLFSKGGRIGEADYGAALPYLLAVIGAIAWASYSALVGRWKECLRNCPISPMGFLLLCLSSALICSIGGHWQPLGLVDITVIILCGLGPFGGAYLLWELALHRSCSAKLGVLAATIPVASTLLLCMVQGFRPNPELLIGAGLMSIGVLLATLPSGVVGKEVAPINNEIQ